MQECVVEYHSCETGLNCHGFYISWANNLEHYTAVQQAGRKKSFSSQNVRSENIRTSTRCCHVDGQVKAPGVLDLVYRRYRRKRWRSIEATTAVGAGELVDFGNWTPPQNDREPVTWVWANMCCWDRSY